MTGLLCFVVPEPAAGTRLDVWLAQQEGVGTRSQLKIATQEGRITVNGDAARLSLRLRGGERIEIVPQVVADLKGGPEPEAIALDVLHEDEAMIAINKPAGLVVHPAVGNRSGTLVNALLHRYADCTFPGSPDRAGIVHRLDRETSGVILVARDLDVHENLSRQFRERTIEKTYTALVRGRVVDAGEIDLPIGRHPRDRKKMSTRVTNGRRSVTFYEPIEHFTSSTLLRVRPRTGRTHQIRVHLAAKGWPVVGDKVYGVGGKQAGTAKFPIERHALHARRIEFDHPTSGERMTIEADLADDFDQLLRALRLTSGQSG